MMRNSLRLLLSRSYTRSSHSFHHQKTLSSLSHSPFITNTTPWNRSIASNFSSAPHNEPNNATNQSSKDLKVTLTEYSGTDASKQHIESELKRVIKNSEWESIERKMKELKMMFASETIADALEDSAGEPNIAYQTFEWLRERPEMFEVDGRIYNIMARIIVQEDGERFWKLVMDMIRYRYGMEIDTFDKAFGYFLDKEMIESAFDLYRFALHGGIKELQCEQCCILLLDKVIGSGEEMDVNLFSKVVRKFVDRGNGVTDIMVDSILNSLRSADRESFFIDKFKEKDEVKIMYGGDTKSIIVCILSVIAKDPTLGTELMEDYSGPNATQVGQLSKRTLNWDKILLVIFFITILCLHDV